MGTGIKEDKMRYQVCVGTNKDRLIIMEFDNYAAAFDFAAAEALDHGYIFNIVKVTEEIYDIRIDNMGNIIGMPRNKKERRRICIK